MKRLCFLRSIGLNLVKRRKDLVIDRPPAIVLNSYVPPFVWVVFVLVVLDVDALLLLFLFYQSVVSRSEGVDIYHSSMDKDFVVD